jgi:hypothetical protein
MLSWVWEDVDDVLNPLCVAWSSSLGILTTA